LRYCYLKLKLTFCHFFPSVLNLKLSTGGIILRPLITHEKIEMLKRDLDTLGEQNLVGIEAYEAIHLLEMLRQTAKIEFIKRAVEGKEWFKKARTGRGQKCIKFFNFPDILLQVGRLSTSSVITLMS